jgi:hypothetical protein
VCIYALFPHEGVQGCFSPASRPKIADSIEINKYVNNVFPICSHKDLSNLSIDFSKTFIFSLKDALYDISLAYPSYQHHYFCILGLVLGKIGVIGSSVL